MTEQNSSKSFFGIYLRYRIKEQKMNLILCVILNVLSLPMLAVAMGKGISTGNQYDDFYLVGRAWAVMSWIALVIIAIAGAAMSFEFYNKKNLTDTLGVLPITNKQRFFGDLIGGYIANVVPVIPFGIAAMVIFYSLQGKFDALITKDNNDIECVFQIGKLGLDIFVSLFFSLTISYLIAVLVTSACGKMFHSTILSVFTIAGLSFFPAGIVGCFSMNMLGIDISKYIYDTMLFFPPIALIKNMYDSANLLENLDFYKLQRAEDIFIVFKPVYIMVWIILGVGLIAGAYFIGKHRKSENVGSSIVFRPLFYISCGLASGGTSAIILSANTTSYIITILLSFFGGGIVCLIMHLIWLPSKKHLMRGIIAGSASILAAFGLCVLFDKTCCFGARLLPENSAKIEYVNANDFITITDKADIETYMKLQNRILRSYSFDNIHYVSGNDPYSSFYKIEYRLANGRIVKRQYNRSLYGNVEQNLDGYGRYFFDKIAELAEANGDMSCFVTIDSGRINIPKDKSEEFFNLIRGEAEEKYKYGAGVYGGVVFNVGSRTILFNVQNDFTKTIAYLEKMWNNIAEINSPDSTYLWIRYIPSLNESELSVTIKYRDKDNELVKELVSLLKPSREDKNRDEKMVISGADYHVPKENSQKVLDILTKMVEE